MSNEAEPEELPDFDAVKLLRWTGLRNLFDAFLYLCAEGRFLFQWQKLLDKFKNNMGNGCGKGANVCKEKVVDIYTGWSKFFVQCYFCSC